MGDTHLRNSTGTNITNLTQFDNIAFLENGEEKNQISEKGKINSVKSLSMRGKNMLFRIPHSIQKLALEHTWNLNL